MPHINHMTTSDVATTDRDFPIQLWDRIAPQVQDLLNLLQASQIDPKKWRTKLSMVHTTGTGIR